MAMLMPLLVLLVLVALPTAFFLGRASVSSSPAPAAPAPVDRGAVAERDAFIEQLRELAWQHRDVSPELSTILIDEIASHHRRLSGPND